MKIRIDMDQQLVWYTICEKDHMFGMANRPLTMEISDTLYRQMIEVSQAFSDVQAQLEVLYREQEGFKPREGDVHPVPHMMLSDIKSSK